MSSPSTRTRRAPSSAAARSGLPRPSSTRLILPASSVGSSVSRAALCAGAGVAPPEDAVANDTGWPTRSSPARASTKKGGSVVPCALASAPSSFERENGASAARDEASPANDGAPPDDCAGGGTSLRFGADSTGEEEDAPPPLQLMPRRGGTLAGEAVPFGVPAPPA